jgi:hypothetical protein
MADNLTLPKRYLLNQVFLSAPIVGAGRQKLPAGRQGAAGEGAEETIMAQAPAPRAVLCPVYCRDYIVVPKNNEHEIFPVLHFILGDYEIGRPYTIFYQITIIMSSVVSSGVL